MVAGLGSRGLPATLVAAWVAVAAAGSAVAQTQSDRGSVRDAIADLIEKGRATTAGNKLAQVNPSDRKDSTADATATAMDPREGEPGFEQARRLMRAIEAILQDTAKSRTEAKKLPSKDDYVIPPLWTETKEDRERKIRDLLDAALGIVTDVPVVDLQRRIEERRRNIRELQDRIAGLKERQLTAPKDALLPGLLNDTVDSLNRDIDDTNKRIQANRDEIGKIKADVVAALAASGVKLSPAQVDLLLDSVLSNDLVKLVAVFDSAKIVDQQLSRMMSVAGENAGAARKYFAMHAALFAMLVHAQDTVIGKIDNGYVPKLDAIIRDIADTRGRTNDLLRAENRPDQKRVLEANRDSQKISDEAAKAYRRYLLQQREQVAAARKRTAHDLRIADNTFETVEASVQLRALMRDTAASFEALQRIEAPTFDQIFRNEELRREFESLTKKLEAPSS
jgi:hypothetical protein